ncbi:MAG: GNAT family N-acetyltransferase [Methanobacteriota archaeon]|nr:MAG: GNAT family N-acetyltransferase [Euryarchaeota archaeon]
MKQKDISFAIDLIRNEGWGHTRVDLERMLSLSPKGSYVWETAGERHGFVTSIRYENTAMIGHLLVTSESRGRNVGKSLLSTLLDDIDSSGVQSTMLYATNEGSGLYRQFGFEESGLELSAIGILVKEGDRSEIETACTGINEEDLADIASNDRKIFGDDRSELMTRLFREFPEHSFKAENAGHISGYILGRRTPIGFDIGPWFCSSGRKDSANLLNSAIRSFPCGGRIDLSSFASNSDVPRIIARYHRYRRTESVKLMIRGERRYATDVNHVLGVAGFELG